MEELKRRTPKKEGPENLDDLFMELFTPEFLESLPPKQIETVINNLKLVESGSETVPAEWKAVRNVLEESGYLVEL
jgi:hypothetical protein